MELFTRIALAVCKGLMGVSILALITLTVVLINIIDKGE